MSIAVHRHGDARACGATTIVSGQSTVFANSKLIAVNGDPNTHGAGNLVAGSNNVFINSIAVVNHSADGSAADNLCPSAGGTHCAPVTAAGSPDVFVGD
tara:strand:- start:378 stop:674 length:297 start_codon:yes stop_codon:yes gene_type:complete